MDDCFLINEINNKLLISHHPKKTESAKKTESIIVKPGTDSFEIQTRSNKLMNDVFKEFYTNVFSMNLNDKQTNEVLSSSLVKGFSSALCESFETNNPSQLVSQMSQELCEKIAERDTKPKRVKNEKENNELFVPAASQVAGKKWKTKLQSHSDIPNHYLSQNTYPYVSIVSTLKSLFNRPEFKSTYFNYNLEKKHKCSENVLFDYCCGENAKKCKLFEDPTAIALELGIDDFEVCSPLKTKAGVHKVTGIYCHIRNLPAEYNSRLENMHLVALCNVQDFQGG